MKFLKGFVHAFRGIILLASTERNFQVHLLALAVVISAGFYFSIHSLDWIILILTSTIVLGLEATNTAIEKMCNEVTLERKPAIKDIKDIAAGAVLVAAIVAVVIAVLVFGKYVK